MHDLADKIAALRDGVEATRKAEADCPANKASLGDKLCPTCQASHSESCRMTGPRYYGDARALRNTALPIIDAQAAQIAALVAERDAAVAEARGLREALAVLAEAEKRKSEYEETRPTRVIGAALTNGGSNG